VDQKAAGKVSMFSTLALALGVVMGIQFSRFLEMLITV
jgi:hypothetical protein